MNEKLEQAQQRGRLVAFILCLFLGFIGAHRFYLNRPFSAVIFFLTLGGLGIFWIFDLLFILCGLMRDGAGRPLSAWAPESAGGVKAALSTLVLSLALLFAFGYVAQFFFSSLLQEILSQLPNDQRFIELFMNMDTASDDNKSSSDHEVAVIEQTPTPTPTLLIKPGDLVRYVDEQGNQHYVDSLERVPEKYRGSMQINPSLPPLINDKR